MKLTETERDIITLVQFQANLSLVELSRLASYKTSTIRYCLDKLTSRGLLRKFVFLNMYALGFSEYRFFVSLDASDRSRVSRLIAALRSNSNVGYIGEIGGEFQYAFSFHGKRTREVHDFLAELAQAFGGLIRRKSISTLISSSHFGIKYLSKKKSSSPPICFGIDVAEAEVDQTDLAILDALKRTPDLSYRTLAKQIGVPHSSFEYRVKRLSANGVICGFGYRLAAQAGINTAFLLVSVKGLHQALRTELFEFCAKHCNVMSLQECIGDWDYSVVVQGIEGNVAVLVAQELEERFAKAISEVKILPSFGVSRLFFRDV